METAPAKPVEKITQPKDEAAKPVLAIREGAKYKTADGEIATAVEILPLGSVRVRHSDGALLTHAADGRCHGCNPGREILAEVGEPEAPKATVSPRIGGTFRTRDGRSVVIRENRGGMPDERHSGDVQPDHGEDRGRVWRPDGTHAYGKRGLDLVEEIVAEQAPAAKVPDAKAEVPTLVAGQHWKTKGGRVVTIVNSQAAEFRARDEKGEALGWWYLSHKRNKSEHTPGILAQGHEDSLVELVSPETFFLVWREDGSVPTKKHKTLDDAKAEAKRLSDANPGAVFSVMRLDTAIITAKSDTVSLSGLLRGAILRTRGGKLVHYVDSRSPSEDHAALKAGDKPLEEKVRYLETGAENWVRLDGKAHRDGSTCPDDLVSVVSLRE